LTTLRGYRFTHNINTQLNSQLQAKCIVAQGRLHGRKSISRGNTQTWIKTNWYLSVFFLIYNINDILAKRVTYN